MRPYKSKHFAERRARKTCPRLPRVIELSSGGWAVVSEDGRSAYGTHGHVYPHLPDGRMHAVSKEPGDRGRPSLDLDLVRVSAMIRRDQLDWLKETAPIHSGGGVSALLRDILDVERYGNITE